MISFKAGLLAFILLLSGCASVGTLSPITYDVRGRIEGNTYTSPSGTFRVRIPELWKPGAKIHDQSPADGGLLVSFTDDLCREFVVSEYAGALGHQSLQDWVDQNIVEKLRPLGITVREIKTVQTRYGTAVSFRYMQPGAAPCGVIQIKEGKRVDTKLDAEVGMYVYHVAGRFYRLIYFLAVGAPGLGDYVFIQRGPVDDLLSRFAAGFEILD